MTQPGMLAIRPATPGDAARLADVGARTFRATYLGQMAAEALESYISSRFHPSIQAAELADPSCRYSVAEVDGLIVGYALLCDEQPPAGLRVGIPVMLSRIYVDAAQQGHGVGAALLADVVGEAHADGRDLLWLTVWERNERAITVYRRWGFTDAGEVAFDLAGQPQLDRVMVLDLAQRPSVRR